MSEISSGMSTESADHLIPFDPNSLLPHPAGAGGLVPTGESCPPPLMWQEVLAAFHSESQPWELNRGSHRLIGRSWGEGPPLYLLNGFAAKSEMYALLIWLLRDSFRCVTFDTELTGAPRQKNKLDDFAADLLAAMDHHGDHSACLFAASFGAAVALRTAIDSPQRIAGLVLQHGIARRRLSWTERMLAAWCRGSGGTLKNLPWRRRVQEANHRRWFPPFDGTRFEFLVESTGSIPLALLSQKASALNSARLESRLSEVGCPVLLVRTEGQGPREEADLAILEKQLPNSRSEWLHSAGLHPYLTHPHRLAKLIKPFFLGNP